MREVREETGLEVAPERVVGHYRRTGFLPHTARVYRCRVVGGTLRPSTETPVVRWWDPHAPPRTLFPWYRAPLADAIAPDGEPREVEERLGVGAILAGFSIDARMRWTDDAAV